MFVGGFAFVFVAQDPNTGKEYALKVGYVFPSRPLSYIFYIKLALNLMHQHFNTTVKVMLKADQCKQTHHEGNSVRNCVVVTYFPIFLLFVWALHCIYHNSDTLVCFNSKSFFSCQFCK